MEYVSVLAGESFSDQPACTHPVLAMLAREVNDLVGDRARADLVTRAPDLARYGRDAAVVTPAVLLAGSQVALQLRPSVLELRWMVRTNRRRLGRAAVHGRASTRPLTQVLRCWRVDTQGPRMIRDLLLRIRYYTFDLDPAARDGYFLAVLDQALHTLATHHRSAAAAPVRDRQAAAVG